MSEPALRKAALAASLLDARSRRRLYATLPAKTRVALKINVREVRQRGWAQRPVVEAALGEEFVAPVQRSGVGLDELVRLATRLEPALYARVLLASELGNSDFLLSLLDIDYAETVRAGLSSTTTLPAALREATLTAARQALMPEAAELQA